MSESNVKEKKNKGGRPSKYTPEIAKEICIQVSTSSKGIERLCSENPHWPVASTIHLWRITHKEFSEMYTLAKINQVEAHIDKTLDIADDSKYDTMINDEGKLVTDNEHINRSRLRIDIRKFIASKLVPKIYGDKIHTEHSGSMNHEVALKELE